MLQAPRGAQSALCALPRAMAALLDALRWPNFISEEDSAQMGTEGKGGVPRFNGDPTRLSEYQFRIRAKQLKEQALSEDERKKHGPLALRLVEGLSGMALRVAQTIEIKELSKPEKGVDTLLTALEKELKPRRAQQARELYAAGSAPHGILSRQSGEPMASYILRRRAWYRCLLDTAEEMHLPDIVLAEQLLASSGLSHDHQLLVRTALQGDVTFTKVADELVAQHSRVHEREKSKGFPSKRSFHGHHHQGHYRKGSGRWQTGYHADEQIEHEYEAEDTAEYYETDETYIGEEMDPLEEQIGFMVADGVDLEDIDSAEAAAEVLQIEMEAYFVRKEAHQKGKGFRPPPAGPRQFEVSGSLSLEERRAKIASLKAKTTCRKCGAVGHWSGDSQCPGAKGGGRKGKPRPGSSQGSSPSSTSASKGSPVKQRTVYFAIHERGASSSAGAEGFMALRHGEPDEEPPRRSFHAVPPPASLAGSSMMASSGEQHRFDEQHGLVPAERRPQWINLDEHGHELSHGLPELPAHLQGPHTTQDEFDEYLLQQALGRLSQPMDVDAPFVNYMIYNLHKLNGKVIHQTL